MPSLPHSHQRSLQEMLGHEDEETTRTHYYKWVRLVEENLLRVSTKAGDQE